MTNTGNIIFLSSIRARRHALWPILLFLFSLSLQACAPGDDSFIGHGYHNFTAYFNAYYNAEVEFEKGLKALQTDPNQTNITGLEIFPPVTEKSAGQEFFSNVITKTSDILKSHPRSSLADDALLLMGKSYYYQAEFQPAERKFQEILTNYPDSDLLDEASFWYGRTLLQEFSIVQAREVLQSVVASPKAHEEVKAKCRFSLAELAIKEQNYQEAIRQIEAGLPAQNDDNIRSRAAFTLARIYNLRGDYAKAAKAYSQVLDLNPTYELRYTAMIGYAISLRENGRLTESAEVLDDLLGDDKNFERFGDIRYELAITYMRQEKLNKAVDLYFEIIR
ncbi:MAG: tetratricopeptide repeat protein, partial [Chlorobiales bacterium]|nr:tetratricopeptide repeat protein [Chlorobiales bacterium]